jgi:hypothetical protein
MEILFRISSIHRVDYVLAKDINDCLFKIRRHYESLDTCISHELFEQITGVEVVSKNIVR